MREDAAGVISRPNGKSELGWARIVVFEDGDMVKGVSPIFEGAFSVNGVVQHVTTKENYLRNRLSLDPELMSPLHDPDSRLVIWRDSDIMSPHEEQLAHFIESSLASDFQPTGPQTCGHDILSFNTDPLENPALRKAVPHPWYDPFGVLGIPFHNGSFIKRDDVAGSGTGTKSVIAKLYICHRQSDIFFLASWAQSAKLQGVRKVRKLYIWVLPPIASTQHNIVLNKMRPRKF
jgi:hypothetical protein